MTPLRALITRTAVVAAVALMAANSLYQHWIAPLETHHAESARELAKLNDRVEGARQEIWEITQHEQSTTALHGALSSLHEHLPSGATLVWLPPRLKTAMSGYGVSEAKVQIYESSAEPALPGFKRTLLHVSVAPQPGLRTVNDALLAAAQIEQQDHFMNIQELAFHAESQEPGHITGFVNLNAFLPESQN